MSQENQDLKDGWGDEDDLELDDDGDDYEQQDDEQEEEEQEGEEEEEEVVFHSTISLASSSSSPPPPSSQRNTRKALIAASKSHSKLDFAEDLVNSNHTPLDAWDFEDETIDVDNDNDDDDEPLTEPTTTVSSSNTLSSSQPARPITTISMESKNDDEHHQALYQELDMYVSHHLELLGSSINAILNAEYNTPDHAQHLVQYYQQRPQLATYTLEKELQRMQYQVHVMMVGVDGGDGGGGDDGDDDDDNSSVVVLTDPARIADYFTNNNNNNNNKPHQHQHDQDHTDWNQIVLGASNQSLLADLLHVMTGPDRLIRPQYFTTCMATQCRFQMNMVQSSNVVVTCHADFEMSLPCHQNQMSSSSSSSSSRLVVATFAADITFQPSHSMIHYQITKLNVVLNQHANTEQALRSVASFLKEMMVDDDDDHHEHSTLLDHNSNNNNDNDDESSADMFRDMFFLEQTQDFIKSQQLGMQSAWNQMGAVVNLQSKLETVSNLSETVSHLLSSGQEAFMSAAAAATASSATTTQQAEEEEISFGAAPSYNPQHETDHSGPRLAPSHHSRPLPPLGTPNLRSPPPPGIRPGVPPPRPPQPPPPPPLPSAPTTTTTRHAVPSTTNTFTAAGATTTATDRPTSILGGFISRLAQSVTNIPDEEDIYRKEYGFSTTTMGGSAVEHHAIPQLYRRENQFGGAPTTNSSQPQYQQQHVLPAPPSLGYPHPKPPLSTTITAPLPAAKLPVTSRVALPFDLPKTSTSTAAVFPSHALPHDDVIVQDGWDDIDDVEEEEEELLFDDNDNKDDHHNNDNVTPPAIDKNHASVVPTMMDYNPEDDIIEPRKRWVNPRPGLRQNIIL